MGAARIFTCAYGNVGATVCYVHIASGWSSHWAFSPAWSSWQEAVGIGVGVAGRLTFEKHFEVYPSPG